eukprot:scaffold41002_cov42-Attheya_sp.AAC.1
MGKSTVVASSKEKKANRAIASSSAKHSRRRSSIMLTTLANELGGLQVLDGPTKFKQVKKRTSCARVESAKCNRLKQKQSTNNSDNPQHLHHHHRLDAKLLRGIHCLGGEIPRNSFLKWRFDETALNQILTDHGTDGKNIYLSMTCEGLDKATYKDLIRREGDENVPTLIAIVSHVPPTDVVASYSIQLQEEEMYFMPDLGLHWTPASIGSRVHYLTSSSSASSAQQVNNSDYLLLHAVRPSQILDVPAEELLSMAIEYKGNSFICDRRDSILQAVSEYTEDGDIHVEDESEVVALFHAERNMQENKLKASLDLKRERFRAMTDFISKKETDVLRKLEDMKVFKIYPCNTPLSTTSNWMGIETGFRKTLMVNRYIGSADGLY